MAAAVNFISQDFFFKILISDTVEKAKLEELNYYILFSLSPSPSLRPSLTLGLGWVKETQVY